jgi:hypothetical protein
VAKIELAGCAFAAEAIAGIRVSESAGPFGGQKIIDSRRSPRCCSQVNNDSTAPSQSGFKFVGEPCEQRIFNVGSGGGFLKKTYYKLCRRAGGALQRLRYGH